MAQLTAVSDIYVKDLNTPLSCLRCWKLADYVQLDTLKITSLSSLEDHFNAMALLSSGSWHLGSTTSTWWGHFVDAFQEVCSEVIMKPFQLTFVTFLWVTRFETLHKRQILDLLNQYPDANELLLYILVRTKYKRIPSWIPRDIEIHHIKTRDKITFEVVIPCAYCKKQLKSCEDTIFYNPFSVFEARIGQLKWCQQCVAKINAERSWPWRIGIPSRRDKVEIAAWSWNDQK